mmetsp:Transcript_114/g.273  ORF Transcript_114/g.273 Transcript_114/m.273 type:complete len:256 (-) Transcript_114:88-855(-)
MRTDISFLRIVLQIFHLNLVRGSLAIVCAADDDDGIPDLGNTGDPALPHHLLVQLLCILERIHHVGVTSLHRAEALTRHPGAGREHGHGHAGTELGHVTRGRAGLRVHHDAFRPHVHGRLDGRRRQRLRRRQLVPRLHRVSYRLVHLVEVDGALGLAARVRHDLDGLAEVASVGRLAREHDGVGTVITRVRDVGTLRAGRTGILDHRFEHLRCGHDGLTRDVRLADHVLLREEDLLGGDFHAQVSARYHDAVRDP